MTEIRGQPVRKGNRDLSDRLDLRVHAGHPDQSDLKVPKVRRVQRGQQAFPDMKSSYHNHFLVVVQEQK
jgi:hypothetical protein